MIVIIGGAYQGKLEYALEKYNLNLEDVCDLSVEDLDNNKKVIYHLERYIYKLLELGEDGVKQVKENIYNWKDKIIICEDISCGIVPTDELMRKFREVVGHSMALLAKEGEEVVRIFCGIETKLKTKQK